MLEDEALHTAARQQAQPPIVFDRYEGLERSPWGNSPPRRLWTAAEQRARASGRMRHLVDTADDAILGWRLTKDSLNNNFPVWDRRGGDTRGA